MNKMTEIENLFNELKQYTNYPASMELVTGEIKRTAFFPGGKGTFDNSEIISNKEIMILGQDWGTKEWYDVDKLNGEEPIKSNPTWVNMLKLLKEDEINIQPNNCFFTNAILGVRREGSGTGKSPAFKDKIFLNYCRDFFKKQIITQKPKLVLVLGIRTAEFLAPIYEKLNVWNKIGTIKNADKTKVQLITNVTLENGIYTNFVLLVHPSFRPSNIARRFYSTFEGNEAEIQMIKEALKN